MNELGMNVSYTSKLFANLGLPIPVYSTGPLAGITLARRVTKLESFPCKELNKPSSHPLSDTSKHLPSEPPPRLISFAHPTSPCLIISLKDEGRRRLPGLQWNPESTAEVLELSPGDVDGNVGESTEEHGLPNRASFPAEHTPGSNSVRLALMSSSLFPHPTA